MEKNDSKEGRIYHRYLIRLDEKSIIELQNCGFQYTTCLVWKKRVLNDELEEGEMSLDYGNGYPELVFKEKKNGIEYFDDYLGNDERKNVEFFLEDGFDER